MLKKIKKIGDMISSLIFRIVAFLISFGFIFVGIDLIIHPFKKTILEKINAFTFLVLGLILIIYGITGKSPYKSDNKHDK